MKLFLKLHFEGKNRGAKYGNCIFKLAYFLKNCESFKSIYLIIFYIISNDINSKTKKDGCIIKIRNTFKPFRIPEKLSFVLHIFHQTMLVSYN